ncbi:MAG: class I SAM-dependent methyltransferase [Minisyncoccota bacterium]
MKEMNCNLCGESSVQVLFYGKDRLHKIDEKMFRIVRCPKCGLARVDPQPSEEELGKYYPEEYGPYQDGDFIFKYGPVSRLTRRFLKSFSKGSGSHTIDNVDKTTLRYLDFGCGGGANLERIKKTHPNWELYGLDTVSTACEEAKKRGFKVFCGDALSIDLPKNFFDRVHMSHVVEHLQYPQETLKSLHKTMKEGGTITIATPNFDTPSARIFKSYWYTLDTPRHLFLFTPTTLSAMIERAGFRIVRIDLDRNPKVLLKSIFYVLGKKDLRINPFLWRIFQVIGRLMGERSIMTAVAVK